MRYNPKIIESKWQKRWFKEKIYEPDLKRAKKPFYNLMMFPYPSADGLHIGSVRTFTGVDIYGRFKRMQGYQVFEPIGLDGFGIHSENYALKIGKHPAELAKITEKNFYRQLSEIGNGFAWSEHVETYDPDYYRWTQWIFTLMFKKGLAYRKKASVNWCSSCLTVLADEQALSGECERCGMVVIKKELEQWFFKITNYAERMLKNLEKIDWSEKVKIAQKNWIGRSEGVEIMFDLVNIPGQMERKHTLIVFTTRPDTVFGATFLVISPERAKFWFDIGWQASSEVKKYILESAGKRLSAKEDESEKEKTGIFSGILAINPANQEKIPVWIADYVLGGVGTGAIMAVPAHDERDFDFAKKFNLPIKIVICPHYPEKICPILDNAYTGEGHLVGSGQFDGMSSEKAKLEITKFVGGDKKIQYRLRDWLISRQRYWGPPIPMIFCESCKMAERGERRDMPGWFAVPEKDLPARLPYIKDFRPTGTDRSPLAKVEKFYKVRCPKCNSWARRETDVSDTFLDSAWYYLRYPSAHEKKKAWNSAITQKWLPVDSYIGGAEHSVLHLLYVRFLAMVFYDLKLAHFEEPFKKFRAHGLITKDGSKMSKSKGNVVSPDEYIAAYGSDAVRMYLAFLAPLAEGGDFRDAGIKGITRFLERVWKMGDHRVFIAKKNKNDAIERAVHKTVKKITEDIENLQYNTAISSLMVLLHVFEENPGAVLKDHWKIFLKLLAPLSPHITEELWQEDASGKFKSIHLEKWPAYNKKLIEEKTFELVVQINGKIKDKFQVAIDISEKEATRLTYAREKVTTILSSRTPRKIIFVPRRLINIVL